MWHRALAVAVVAAQLALMLVERIVMVAALAFGDPATLMAQQRGGIATTVKEQDHLVAVLQVVLHAFQQGLREPDLQRQAFQIDQMLIGRFGVACPLGQFELTVFA